MTAEYPGSLEIREVEFDEETLENRMADFAITARRLVHLGEVSYKDRTDPLCLAVSQTFKVEKEFAETHFGCTQAVADAVKSV